MEKAVAVLLVLEFLLTHVYEYECMSVMMIFVGKLKL